MATRSRYRLFTAKEKQKTLEKVQREESMMWAKVVFMTGAKNKMRLIEKNSNRRAFRGQKARHPEPEKRLCDYVNDKRQYGCTVTSEMCQLKALAITKEQYITGFKAILRLCQAAAGKRVPTWLIAGIGVAWQWLSVHSTRMLHCPLLAWDSLYLQRTLQVDALQANLYFS